MPRGDETTNRQAISALPDGSIVLVWFDGDTEPRVLRWDVSRGALCGAYSATNRQMHYPSLWTNGHAWFFERYEVIWQPPVDRTAELLRLLDGIPIEPGWLLDMLGERGLTICERGEAA